MSVNLAGKKVFVTGATGFVGQNVVERLSDLGATVGALVLDEESRPKKNTIIFRGNIQNYLDVERAVKRFSPDYVIHLAAQPLVNVAILSPLDTLSSNINGSVNLLQSLVGEHARAIIFMSTDKVYGSNSVNASEMTELNGAGHPYDVSKHCADLIAQMYANVFCLPIIIVRSGNIYGAGDSNYSRLIPGAIKSALLGVPLDLRSDGTMVRDYIHVDDVIDAFLILLDGIENKAIPHGSAVNLGSRIPASVLDVIGEVRKLMDGAPEVNIVNDAEHEIPHQHLNWSYAERLGWTPKTSMEDGIRKTIQWHKERLHE